MLLSISGILARIPVKGEMAHALHCSYKVGIVKVARQILLTPGSRAGLERRKIGRCAAVGYALCPISDTALHGRIFFS
jgi:hypothetical protein